VEAGVTAAVSEVSAGGASVNWSYVIIEGITIGAGCTESSHSSPTITRYRRYRDVRLGEGGRAAVVVHAEAKADADESAKQKRVAAFTIAAKNRSVCARAAQAGGEGAARAARRRLGSGDGEEDGDEDNNEEMATRPRGETKMPASSVHAA